MAKSQTERNRQPKWIVRMKAATEQRKTRRSSSHKLNERMAALPPHKNTTPGARNWGFAPTVATSQVSAQCAMAGDLRVGKVDANCLGNRNNRRLSCSNANSLLDILSTFLKGANSAAMSMLFLLTSAIYYLMS